MTPTSDQVSRKDAPPTRAWMVNAWSTATWSLPDDQAQWCRWAHVSTTALDRDTDGRLFGETVWALQTEEHTIGAGWEWVEWQPGVIILMDPMAIASNVSDFSSKAGAVSRAIALNVIAHELPWRECVLGLIAKHAQAHPRPAARETSALPMRLAA